MINKFGNINSKKDISTDWKKGNAVLIIISIITITIKDGNCNWKGLINN